MSRRANRNPADDPRNVMFTVHCPACDLQLLGEGTYAQWHLFGEATDGVMCPECQILIVIDVTPTEEIEVAAYDLPEPMTDPEWGRLYRLKARRRVRYYRRRDEDCYFIAIHARGAVDRDGNVQSRQRVRRFRYGVEKEVERHA